MERSFPVLLFLVFAGISFGGTVPPNMTTTTATTTPAAPATTAANGCIPIITDTPLVVCPLTCCTGSTTRRRMRFKMALNYDQFDCTGWLNMLRTRYPSLDVCSFERGSSIVDLNMLFADADDVITTVEDGTIINTIAPFVSLTDPVSGAVWTIAPPIPYWGVILIWLGGAAVLMLLLSFFILGFKECCRFGKAEPLSPPLSNTPLPTYTPVSTKSSGNIPPAKPQPYSPPPKEKEPADHAAAPVAHPKIPSQVTPKALRPALPRPAHGAYTPGYVPPAKTAPAPKKAAPSAPKGAAPTPAPRKEGSKVSSSGSVVPQVANASSEPAAGGDRFFEMEEKKVAVPMDPAQAKKRVQGIPYIVLFDVVDTGETILQAEEGDVVLIEPKDYPPTGDWCWAHLGKDEGYIPSNYLKKAEKKKK